jgi:alpha-mannosidase
MDYIVKQVLQYLMDKAVRDKVTLDEWQITSRRDVPKDIIFSRAKAASVWEKLNAQGIWGKSPGTYWLRTSVRVPSHMAPGPLVLHINLGSVQEEPMPWVAGLKMHAEGLLYVNGTPFHGLDPNHGEVLLASKVKGGDVYNLLIEAYTTSETPKRFVATLGFRDNQIYSLLHDFKALLMLCETLGYESSIGRDIATALVNASFKLLVGEDFQQASDEATHILRQTLERISGGRAIRNCTTVTRGSRLFLSLVGHSHIDLAWLWTMLETRRKIARTFSTTLRYLEQYPFYVFCQSSPQMYAFCKKDYPDIYRRIKKWVGEHRWEPVGGMWVEPDCNLTSGESLVRQILLGKQFFKKEFGIDTRVLWLPDVFGYTGSLPQILKQSGMDYFITTKLHQNDTNKPRHMLFWWEGIDGSRVLTHFPFTYVNEPIPMTILEWIRRMEGLQSQPVSLIPVGFGDGGGGITQENLETANRLMNLPFFPKMRFETVNNFTLRMKKFSLRVPVIKGELYFENHRGTYTTLSEVKRANRRCEQLLRQAEIWISLAELVAGKKINTGSLKEAWRLLLINQFHDILPGSSIREVYQNTHNEYRQIETITGELIKRAQRSLNNILKYPDDEGEKYGVFNALSWDRTDIVRVECPRYTRGSLTAVDCDGRRLSCQKVSYPWGEKGIVFCAHDVPPLGARTYSITEENFSESVVAENVRLKIGPSKYSHGGIVMPAYVENRFFRLVPSKAGGISRLYDKIRKVDVFEPGKTGNHFQTFIDEAPLCEPWDILPQTFNRPVNLFELVSQKVVECGPVRAVIRNTFRSQKSKIVQDTILYANVPRIDFITCADWHEQRVLLKAAFPFNVRAKYATCEIAFGAIRRSTQRNTDEERARFEVPMHRWVDISRNGFGVSLLNDCKYGCDVQGNLIRLSLIRSPSFAQANKEDGFVLKTPGKGANFTDQGEHRFTYSVLAHGGDWRKQCTIPEAHALNCPLTGLRIGSKVDASSEGIHGKSGLKQFHMDWGGWTIRTDSDNIVVETLKPAEDGNGYIIRLYESCGYSGRVKIDLPRGVGSVTKCDLMERQKSSPVRPVNGQFSVNYKPFEILTFRLWGDLGGNSG